MCISFDNNFIILSYVVFYFFSCFTHFRLPNNVSIETTTFCVLTCISFDYFWWITSNKFQKHCTNTSLCDREKICFWFLMKWRILNWLEMFNGSGDLTFFKGNSQQGTNRKVFPDSMSAWYLPHLGKSHNVIKHPTVLDRYKNASPSHGFNWTMKQNIC